MNTYNNPKTSGLLARPTLTIVLALAVVLLGLSFGKEALRQYAVSKEIAALEQQVEDVEQQQMDLSVLTSYLQSEAYLEREARLKLGLLKPGEQEVIVGDIPSGIPELAERPPYADISVPRRWMVYLFDPATFAGWRSADR